MSFPLFVNDKGFLNDESEAGAVSAEHPTNPWVIKALRGQRTPRQITIENYINRNDGEKKFKGVLPKSTREQVPHPGFPMQETTGDTINFFSGNPFVEVTKGILHLYKKKYEFY